MTPEVSVIIPNYNHQQFLKERIESVLQQTFQNFEIIILDDCSTDNSRDIIELYRSNAKVKKILYNDINSGSPFKQWEKGFKYATGKYIWIAESDDSCNEHFLESALKSLSQTKYKLHYCQSINIDEKSNIISDNFWWTKDISTINWHQQFYMDGKEFIQKAMQFKNVIPNASAVVFLKEDTDFDQLKNYKTAGDWLFWINILRSSGVSYSNETLNKFRSHNNTTRNARNATLHRKFILRHYEILSIKYLVFNKHNLVEKRQVFQFLQTCIDISSVRDILFFAHSCIKFHLPKSFIARFIVRKFVVNRFSNVSFNSN